MLSEMEQFQQDLLESVKQMKRREVSRLTLIATTEALQARLSVDLSQTKFTNSLRPLTLDTAHQKNERMYYL